jgi:FKBP-type peptidyl-prolyl cis-trans isomerase SlyD
MQDNNNHNTVGDNMVVSLDYKLTVDGEIIDASEKDQPIQFIQGQGQIIAGLERGLYGMEVGESRDVQVAAAEGYGEEDPEAYSDVPRGDFPDHIPLEPGVRLQLKDQDGETKQAHIVSVDDEDVRLSFNHPLAGKDLSFEVKVVDLRLATQEEIDHGHIHE